MQHVFVPIGRTGTSNKRPFVENWRIFIITKLMDSSLQGENTGGYNLHSTSTSDEKQQDSRLRFRGWRKVVAIIIVLFLLLLLFAVKKGDCSTELADFILLLRRGAIGSFGDATVNAGPETCPTQHVA